MLLIALFEFANYGLCQRFAVQERCTVAEFETVLRVPVRGFRIYSVFGGLHT